MNKQISRIAVLALLLIAALIVATTYWQGWAASSLAAKQDNSIQQVAQFQIKRGLIYASNGTTVLAANTAVKHKGAPTTYVRRYPTNGFAAQVVGYSTVGRSRSGIEQSEKGYLTASNANLGTIFDKLEKKLSGATVVGNNVILNLDVKAQNIAQRDLFGKCGAAVVLNPQTGAVLAMASSPKFDPNDIESGKGYAGILKSPSACPGSSSAGRTVECASPMLEGTCLKACSGGSYSSSSTSAGKINPVGALSVIATRMARSIRFGSCCGTVHIWM